MNCKERGRGVLQKRKPPVGNGRLLRDGCIDSIDYLSKFFKKVETRTTPKPVPPLGCPLCSSSR